MVRTIDVYRHTDNDGDILTPQGVADAMALGERLDLDYAFCVSTGAQRSTQAIACALAAAGRRVASGVVVEPALRSRDEDRWRAAYQQAGSAELAGLRAAEPAFVEQETRALGEALRRVLDAIADGNAALVVGHSPTSEAAVLGLTGTEIAPLGKGEGVRIEEDGGAFTVAPLP